MLEAVRALLRTGGRLNDIRLVVEIRRRAQVTQLDAIGVVAALDVVGARVGERQVRPQLQVVNHPVRPFEAHGGAGEVVVRPDDHALLVVVVPREEERRAVVPAGHGEPVIQRVPHAVDVVRVVEYRRPRRDRRPPRAPADAGAGLVALAVHEHTRRVAARERIGMYAASALPETRLQRVGVVDVVERRGRPEAEVRRARAAGLGRDQNHAKRRARAVDRARRRPLQDLHRLDVVRIDVSRAVRLNGPLGLAAGGDGPAPVVGSVEVRRRERGVVDRHAIDHEQRLVGPEDRADAPDVDERARARVTRLLQHGDVGCLSRERLHNVRLACLLDQIRRHVVAHVAQLLRFSRGPGAGHDHFAELQRVGREHEVVRHAARGEGDLGALRLVAQASRGHRHGLARDAGAGHDDRVTTVVFAQRAQPHGRNRDFDLP